jgi:hypothetical protein
MLLDICSGYEIMRCSRIKQHNCRRVIDEKHTNDYIRSFQGFLHSNTVDSPTSIVLLGSNRNRVGSTSRARCSSSSLISTGAWIGALVSIMALFSTVVAPTISLHQVLGCLGPLNTLIPSSRSLGIVGALNHLMLKGRKSLNGLNDGLAYALEARDFENFQVMVNKALVLENRRGVMEHKRKLVCQHQSGSSFRPRV